MFRRLTLVAFAALALPTAAPAEPSSARLLNQEELVSADDYPQVAQRNGQQGGR